MEEREAYSRPGKNVQRHKGRGWGWELQALRPSGAACLAWEVELVRVSRRW